MEKRFSKIKVVLGLGNLGAEYEKTYHNAGKLMLDYLSEVLFSENDGSTCSPQAVENPGFKKLSSSGCFEIMKIDGVALAKTLTYMNESGKVAKLVLKNLKAEAYSLIVVHDDSDIELGEYKISFGRGSAGHNGAQSVIKSLGTKNFWRLRIGIRRGTAQTGREQTQTLTNNFPRKSALSQRKSALRPKAEEFVLKKITASDKKLLRSAFEKAHKEVFA